MQIENLTVPKNKKFCQNPIKSSSTLIYANLIEKNTKKISSHLIEFQSPKLRRQLCLVKWISCYRVTTCLREIWRKYSEMFWHKENTIQPVNIIIHYFEPLILFISFFFKIWLLLTKRCRYRFFFYLLLFFFIIKF